MMRTIFITIIFLAKLSYAFTQPKVGSIVPDISLPNDSNLVTKLSSLKGKVVLIDFWASWCMPCRRSNREVTPLYDKYRSKGFEIFSVSVDANKNAWKQALQQDNIQWVKVIDTRAANGNELTRTWGINYIPSAFLIDKTGKLIAENPRDHELEKFLKKLLSE